jgi:beta-hydroxylase
MKITLVILLIIILLIICYIFRMDIFYKFLVNLLFKRCSNIGNEPFYSPELLPECRILSNNWKIFREEALKSYKSYNTIKGDLFFTNNLVNKESEWTKLYIKWHSDIDKTALNKCPESCKIIEKIPGVKIAMFSVLSPHSKINAHSGLYKGCLRYHLGLSTPNSEECYIVVDKKKYSWKDGEGILIDDTFEHWVVNDTDQVRIILFCDIIRPMNNFGNKLNHFLINNLGHLTSREN